MPSPTLSSQIQRSSSSTTIKTHRSGCLIVNDITHGIHVLDGIVHRVLFIADTLNLETFRSQSVSRFTSSAGLYQWCPKVFFVLPQRLILVLFEPTHIKCSLDCYLTSAPYIFVLAMRSASITPRDPLGSIGDIHSRRTTT